MHVYPNATVTGTLDAPDLGDVGDGCQIHADVFCGQGVHIAPNVTIVGSESVTLGDGVTLSPGVVIYSSRPSIDAPGRNCYREGHRSISGEVTLESDVFVGSNTVIGQGTTIAEGVAIGACSYVERNITEPRTFWAGTPVTKRRRTGIPQYP